MNIEQQLKAYHKLQSRLGWRERRGFDNQTDCWMQHGGIAVWVNSQSGLNIGIKNPSGSGYMGLENYSSKRLDHPPRWKMSFAEVVPLWLQGYQRLKDFRHQCTLAIILGELEILNS